MFYEFICMHSAYTYIHTYVHTPAPGRALARAVTVMRARSLSASLSHIRKHQSIEHSYCVVLPNLSLTHTSMNVCPTYSCLFVCV